MPVIGPASVCQRFGRRLTCLEGAFGRSEDSNFRNCRQKCARQAHPFETVGKIRFDIRFRPEILTSQYRNEVDGTVVDEQVRGVREAIERVARKIEFDSTFHKVPKLSKDFLLFI